MTVIYYMRGVVVADEQDARTPWSMDHAPARYDGLPPGFLPKPQPDEGKTTLTDAHKVDTRALKRAKRGHRSPKNVPQDHSML